MTTTVTQTTNRKTNGITDRFKDIPTMETASTILYATGGYYASKMLYDHLKGDITKPAAEGTAEKFIRDFPEIPSVSVIFISSFLPRNERRAVMAGAGVNLIGHLLDRFQKYRKPAPA